MVVYDLLSRGKGEAMKRIRVPEVKDKPALIAAIIFSLMILAGIAVMTILVVSAGPSMYLNQAMR